MKLKDKKYFVYDIIDIIQNIYTYSTKKTPIFKIIAFTFFLKLKVKLLKIRKRQLII